MENDTTTDTLGRRIEIKQVAFGNQDLINTSQSKIDFIMREVRNADPGLAADIEAKLELFVAETPRESYTPAAHPEFSQLFDGSLPIVTTFLNSLPLPVFIKDDQGAYVFVNKAFTDYALVSPGDMQNRTIRDVYPPEYAATFDEYEKQMFSEGRAVFYEIEIPHRDNTPHHLLVYKSPVVLAPHTYAGSLGVVFDITRQKETETALQQEEAKFRTIFDSTNDAITISSLEGYYLECNETFFARTGRKREEIGKLCVTDIVHPRHWHLLAERLAGFQGGIKPQPFECEVVSTEGYIPVEIDSRLFTYKDKPVLLSIVRDISERREVMKKVHQAIMSTEEKERRRLSEDLHDQIGPLLSGIKLIVNELGNNNQPSGNLSELTNYLTGAIDEAIERTRSISQELIPGVLTDYGLIQAVNSQISRINAMPNQLINFTLINQASGYRLHSSTEYTLYRIITELISNTLRHSGASRCSISFVREENRFNITYTDNGKGFDMEEQRHREKGMGLRLIASRLKTLDCDFRIQSAHNEGINVYISIQCAE